MALVEDVFWYLWACIKALKPSFLSKTPHFNFITVHYFWIIGLSILGSILIFANGRIAYIDALLLASGGATQAGLNTVDVNNLTTFQQCVIFFLAMLANPITVNSFVVFLRLYWFEKRFEHIVLETRGRRLFTFSKSKSMAKNGESLAEMGVNGRNIRVMHGGGKRRVANDGTLLETDGPRSQRRPSTYRGVSPGMGRRGTINGLATAPTRDTEAEASPPQPPAPGMQLKFAETVKRSDGVEDSPLKLPVPNEEASIAILQKQRGGGDDGETLRIPGPRDAERGAKPKRLEAGDLPEPDDGGGDDNEEQEREGPAGPALHTTRATTEDSRSPSRHSMQAPVPETQRHQTITIEEPERRMRDELLEDAVALAWTAEALGLRKPRIFKDGLHSKKHHSHHSNGGGLSKSRTNASRVLRPLERIRTALSKEKDKDDLMPYLSWQPTLGRNSAFVGLTEEQREELGGIEYRSLKTLAMVLAGYYWGFWIFAVITLLPWILHNSTWGPIVDKAGVSRAWWGIFTANSAFNDLGFTLTPDSMNSFNTAQFPLLIMSFLIICGNTGFPIMLRFIIWILSKVMPRGSDVFQELHFLLDHPRRCFTLLFPSSATWWLFWVLVILNVVDLIFFVILDFGSGPVAELPLNIRFLDGWFQAASTRTAGFSCVNLALLHPAVQTSYLIMMYISVFPIAISVRRTNVYEEKSLGIYYPEETADDSEPSYVATHLRRQLSFDLWFIFLGYFIITISEGNRLMAGDPNFSMFAVLFDIVSAYGTVGLSLGFPSVNTSFCGQFGVIGKLVIIAMQIRGRHRGLPYGLDRAILLPSEALNRKEAAEADARAQRRASMSSNRLADNSGDGPQSAGGQPPTPSGIFASGSSTMPGGAYSPYQRGTSARRGRSMSVDRLNTNLLSQFLAPGPTFPRHRSPSRRSGRSVYAMNTIRDNHIATANGGMWPAAAANIHPGARNAHTEPATPAPDVDNEKGKDGDGIDNLPGPGHASLRVGTADSVSGGGLNVPPGGGGATGNGVSSGSGTSRPHARRAETVPAVPLPRASEERE